MINNVLAQSDIEELMNDDEGRKALASMIVKMNHALYCAASSKETQWPYNERLRESTRLVEPHLARIAEEKRKKREEEKKAKK